MWGSTHVSIRFQELQPQKHASICLEPRVSEEQQAKPDKGTLKFLLELYAVWLLLNEGLTMQGSEED